MTQKRTLIISAKTLIYVDFQGCSCIMRSSHQDQPDGIEESAKQITVRRTYIDFDD